jgi:hypothetical protein
VKQFNRSVRIAGFVFGVVVAMFAAQAEVPATAPTTAEIKTGELDLTFTQRSPLSTRKELARRLNLKLSELGEDYDLATRPFKVYVPPNYNPAVPHGVFVYLGYKDSVSVATPWEPVFDKSHLIFVTPVCHHGEAYPNEVPAWQTMGLAFDAVENLKRLYNVDTRRLYLMSFHDQSLRMSFGAADVFTGFLSRNDYTYCQKMVLPDRRVYEPGFPPPPSPLLTYAKRRAIVLLDESFTDPDQPPQLNVICMKRDGFSHVMGEATTIDDVHFPDLKPEWFEGTVLPFLDKAAASAAEMRPIAESPAVTSTVGTSPAATGPSPSTTGPAVAAVPDAPAGNPNAERLLRMAKLYIQNGQTNLARTKLESILSAYPKDPSAVVAKKLLADLPEK